MAIDIEWQYERGRMLARYEGPAIDRRVWSLFPTCGSCLRFIDPYGDTVFNQAQIGELAAELDAMLVSDQVAPPERVSALEAIVGALSARSTLI